MAQVGAISRSHASHGAAKASPPIGFDRGYEAWRPALIAFCERDELRQMADNLRRGQPLGYIEKRMIDALRAAFQEIAA